MNYRRSSRRSPTHSKNRLLGGEQGDAAIALFTGNAAFPFTFSEHTNMEATQGAVSSRVLLFTASPGQCFTALNNHYTGTQPTLDVTLFGYLADSPQILPVAPFPQD